MLNMYSVVKSEGQLKDSPQTTATACFAAVFYKQTHHVLGLNLGPQTNFPD